MNNKTTLRGKLILSLMVLGAPAHAAQMAAPVSPVSAALFRPAAPQWGAAFAGVSSFLATPQGASLAQRYPFVGALKGFDAASPEALTAIAPMVERISAGNPFFHAHMARVESLTEGEQKQVLAVVAYAHEQGARDVETRIDAAIASYRATGDVSGLIRLADAAPAYAVYGDAVHLAPVRAFITADRIAKGLAQAREDDLAVKAGAAARSSAFLAKREGPRAVRAALAARLGRLLKKPAPGVHGVAAFALLAGLWSDLSARFADADGFTLVLGTLGALVLLGLLSRSGRREGPPPEADDYRREREDRRLDAKSVEDAARRRNPGNW